MDLFDIFKNYALGVATLGWFWAQLLKGIFYYFKEKRINFRRFVGAGGMPSSHSAFVTALAVAVGKSEGWTSSITALAIVFALIVMYDAAGVRRAAGKQAAILNRMVEEIFEEGQFHHERLIEFLGHSPIEVFAGSLLGLIIAMIC